LVTRGQQKILQLMAKGRPPQEALAELCHLVDRHGSGTFSSLFAADPEGRTLTLSAAPGMPEALMVMLSSLGGLKDTEAFGTAALLAGRAWESEDLDQDPGWGELGPAARRAGLGAWSALPVFGPDRRVLGAFTLGKAEPGAFLDSELGLLRSTVGLASIAFQQIRQREESRLHGERFHRLAMELPTGVFEADSEGNCTFVNEAFCTLTGLQPMEALGQGWLKAIHPLDRGQVQQEWTRCMQSGMEFRGLEWRVLRPDGSIRWVVARVKVMPGRSWLGMLHDITERRALEEALTASERLARSILECAPIGIQVFDAQGNSLAVNQARLEPALNRGDPASGPFNVLTDPESVRSGLATLYAAAYRGEVVERPIVDLPSKVSGEQETHFNQVLYPVVDDQKRVTAVVSLSRDISREVRAEKALRQEKARFEALVQNALDLIFTLDSKGRLAYISPSIRTILGFWNHEMAGRTVFRLVHPADRPLVQRAVEALRGGAARETSIEVRARHKDGGFRWLLARGSDQTANPAVGGLVFNCSDVTRIKGMADEILEREQKLQLVMASTGDATWDWDLVTGIVEHNARWRKLTGDEDQDESHHPVQIWAARVHPEDMAQVMGALNTHFMGKTEQYRAEYRYLHRGGHWIWILDRGKIVSRDSDGRPLRLAGTMAEVTSRKEAELALQASETRMRAVVAALPDTYLRLGPQGVLLDAEVHGALVAGRTPVVVGRPLQEAPFPEGLKHQLLASTAEALRTAQGKEFRLAVPLGGEERHFDVRVQPNGSGEALCLIRDITEQHRTEEYLHQTQKLESLGLLAGGIAHDFNNLFQGLMGNLNLAEMQVGEATLPLIRRMEGIVQRAAELTQRLLHYSGKGFFLVKLTNLSQALMDMSELLRVSVPKTIALRLDLAPDLPLVEVDLDQLQQVVLNMVTNALEALDALEGAESAGAGKGTIIVATGTEMVPDAPLEGYALEPAGRGLHAVLEVRDDGPGMDAEQLARCFDPFYTTKHPGRGLGLPASLGILRRHKGGIQVRSAPGHGTAIRILLPVAQRHEPPAPPVLGARGRILLVDDDTVVRQVTGDVLRNLGYDVKEAVDGQDALERFQAAPEGFSLVLMDLVMPRMDGYAAFRAMRAILPSIPVVFISGYSQQEVPMPAEVQGHAGFLQKPFQISKLEELLDEILRPHMSR
jgi:PAS domain S-box-containing protein